MAERVIKPTPEQLRALQRLNFVSKNISHAKENFAANPDLKSFIIQAGTPEAYTFSKEQGLTLLENARRSLERSMRDAGLKDKEWADDFQGFIKGEPAKPKGPLCSDIDQEGHAMLPVFKSSQGQDKVQEVLYYRCRLCKPTRINYPKNL